MSAEVILVGEYRKKGRGPSKGGAAEKDRQKERDLFSSEGKRKKMKEPILNPEGGRLN